MALIAGDRDEGVLRIANATPNSKIIMDLIVN